MPNLAGPGSDQIPASTHLGRLAYMNPEAVVLEPQASANPQEVGDMVFQLTSNVSLTIKVKGSDGVVRSGSITLV